MIVDSDDPTLPIYYTLLNGIGQVVVVEPGRRGMVAALQAGFEVFKGQLGFAVGFMGDDHRPRTVGWDTNYLNTLRELRTGLVYGNDLFQFENIPTQVAMTTDIPEKLGYLCPPEFDHLCVDVVWKDWGQAIERLRYLKDTVVEHVHYLPGKSSFDKTYAVVAYQNYNHSGRFEADVAKLKELVGYEGSS
jgi:hypothetical protein